MVKLGSLVALVRSTPRDAVVLVLTMGITIAVDLITAVVVGLAVAIVLALRTVASTVRVEQVPLEPGDHSAEEHALLAEHIIAYRFDGPLFFAGAHRFLLELSDIADVKVVILRMSRVSTVDATGARVLGDVITRLEQRGTVVLLSGIRPWHDQVLSALGVAEHLRRDGLVFGRTRDAIGHARHRVLYPVPAPRTSPAEHAPEPESGSGFPARPRH